MTAAGFIISLILPALAVLFFWARYVWLPNHDDRVIAEFRRTPGVLVMDVRPMVKAFDELAQTVVPKINAMVEAQGREIAREAELIANRDR